MGRPRKLRPEEMTVTASPDQQGEITTTFIPDNTPAEISTSSNGKDMLPFYGSDSVKVGERRYFVAQGRKLIVKYLKTKGKDEKGNILYKLESRCVANIPRNKKGQLLGSKLKKLKIPGAENIGL